VWRLPGSISTCSGNISGGHDGQHGVYATESWTFTATTRHTRLRLLSRDRVLPGRQNGPVIAAVAVTAD
jgi:hypothetical protein